MDLKFLISVLSVMHTWILCTVLSAPAAETPTSSTSSSSTTQGRHVRTKRCSCATFLDKECVYFCHLDIIWVNTPERVVSYGLGDAPRTKRALPDSARCRCSRENDNTCRDFCRLDTKQLRYGPVPDHVIRSAGGKHKLAADPEQINRIQKSDKKQVSPPAIREKSRLLFQRWRVRQRHRARAWEGESAAS